MLSREEFQQRLTELVAELKTKTAGMSEQEIRGYFKEAGLSEEQMHMVVEYAATVQGTEENLTQQDRSYQEEYQAMLSAMPWPDEEEMRQLVSTYLEMKGERESGGGEMSSDPERLGTLREQLTGAYLPLVLPIARNMQKPGMLLEDLLQEGNLGVTLGVMELTAERDPEEQIKAAIEDSIRAYQAEQETLDSKEKLMIAQVEMLNDSINRLEKELGRKVMVEELALDMNISENEVLDILKLTGELPEELERYEHELNHGDEGDHQGP